MTSVATMAAVRIVAAFALSAGASFAGEARAAVSSARATDIPNCTAFVDAASAAPGDGSVQKPHSTIAAAVAAAPEKAVICVAEGVYAEQIAPGEKGFTLAGGFQRGFKARDSARFVSKAQGAGGSFVRIVDPGPKGAQLTAIDGFEITGYAQALFRDFYEPQRFDITNNFIHDNTCGNDLVGAAFNLNNTTSLIAGNVIFKNACGRGGGGALNDELKTNSVRVENNLFEGNAGTEPAASHGGALYGGSTTLTVTGNAFVGNSVTQWGAGLYVTAYPEGGQTVAATLSGNVYRGNRAGNAGGGFFCDGGAKCVASNELYDGNCGGNVYVDSGSETSGPTIASFDRITNVNARSVGCEGPGVGVRIDIELKESSDQYTFTNAVFWGNAEGRDFTTGCNEACTLPKVTVSHSMAQTKFLNNGLAITFGAGMIAPADPMFVSPETGDYTLKAGSPAAGKGATIKVGAGAAQASKPPAGAEPAAAPSAPPPAPAAPPAAPSTAAAPPPSAAPAATSDAPAAPSASPGDPVVKQAFEDARQLGTVAAWNAFLMNYPEGFHADLARAYRRKLTEGETPAGAPAAPTPNAAPAAAAEPAPPAASPVAPSTPTGAATAPAMPAATRRPALTRGAKFFGFPEKFNRYYTDPAWRPTTTLYVSAAGAGDGASRKTPMAPAAAIAAAKPGTRIEFAKGDYQACYSLEKANSGTYDAPVVLYGERNADQSLGVKLSCCASGRKSCLNLEQTDHVAIDGFELVGGKYGVRAVSGGYAQSEHLSGLAVLNSRGHDQDGDPFFTGAADWTVFEGNAGYDAKTGDGHGFYLSNGGDWNIVRHNETWGNSRSDFQINPDPASTCKEVGIPFADPRCDAFAGTGEGGQGASDYFLVESNYFHHNTGNGPNFTSTRRSVVRNNIFAFQARHNVSFWQETDNPKLGASGNRILHNLFVSTGKPGLQFANGSTRNEVANNILIGVTPQGAGDPNAVLMAVDDASKGNTFRANLYASGKLEGRAPTPQESVRQDVSPAWFARFPTALNHDPNDFAPTPQAPFLDAGARAADAPTDRNGAARGERVDLGPIEIR